MIFGDHVEAADDAVAAEWIAGACTGAWWTVGALVPSRYSTILRVHAPEPGDDGWWSAYRDLYRIITSIGERLTSTPDRAWFAVWEGHGFDNLSTTRAALRQVPRFHLPNRSYYLLKGPVSAATQLRHPEPPNEWRNPDLYWPDDRRWFVATDVDFWSLYVGGDDDFIAELGGGIPTRTEIVPLDRQLEIED